MNKYLFTILLFSLMSFSPEKNLDSTKSRLSYTEEYLYSGSTIFKTVESFYYSQNKLDSIVKILTENNHKDWPTKKVFTFKFNLDTVDVFIEGRYYPTPTKICQYGFNSNGNLSKFLIYGKDRIARDQTFTYDKKNKKIKVETIERRELDDYENRKESIFFMNDSNNIDSTYEYFIRNQQRELYSKKVFKYDTKPNPYKNLLYSIIQFLRDFLIQTIVFPFNF